MGVFRMTKKYPKLAMVNLPSSNRGPVWETNCPKRLPHWVKCPKTRLPTRMTFQFMILNLPLTLEMVSRTAKLCQCQMGMTLTVGMVETRLWRLMRILSFTKFLHWVDITPQVKLRHRLSSLELLAIVYYLSWSRMNLRTLEELRRSSERNRAIIAVRYVSAKEVSFKRQKSLVTHLSVCNNLALFWSWWYSRYMVWIPLLQWLYWR